MSQEMTPGFVRNGRVLWIACSAALAFALASPLVAAQKPAATPASQSPAPPSGGAQLFDTPEQAADALIDAAEKFDVSALTHIFGPSGNDIVFTGEIAQDRKHASDFAAQARIKK